MLGTCEQTSSYLVIHHATEYVRTLRQVGITTIRHLWPLQAFQVGDTLSPIPIPTP
jgi:hypothetical protein